MWSLYDHKEFNVSLSFFHQPPKCKLMITYAYKCIGASGQRRPFIHTRLYVRCSLVCESGVEVEPGGKCLQSVRVHNSETLKDMYCDVCAVY
jgi:hypothetical protein